jgi:hypothetical protein
VDWYAIGQVARLVLDDATPLVVGGCVGWLLAYDRYAPRKRLRGNRKMTENTTRYQPGKHGPVRLSTTDAAPVEERESFFYIDEREYTIVKEPSPALGLEFLALIGQRGEAAAVAQMFDKLVEPGALRALSRVKGIKQGDVEALMSVVQEKLMAVAERVSGN